MHIIDILHVSVAIKVVNIFFFKKKKVVNTYHQIGSICTKRCVLYWPLILKNLDENGQIPPFCKICSKKALFQNLLVIYHFSATQVLQT